MLFSKTGRHARSTSTDTLFPDATLFRTRTNRPPRRATAAPQTTRVSITARVGAAATVPASARLRPRRSWRTGMRKAGPWIVTAAAAWASVLAASIVQRRALETVLGSTDLFVIWTKSSHEMDPFLVNGLLSGRMAVPVTPPSPPFPQPVFF